jgi:hypothetical protein
MQVFAAATGWGRLPGAPFLVEQAWGAWMAFAALAFYSARNHLQAAWRTLWDQPGGIDDAREPIPYRFAFAGIALGITYLVAFWIQAGAAAGTMLLYFVLYYALFAAVTKMRAQIGPPTHELGQMATTHILARTIGTDNLREGTLTAFTFLWFNNRMVRSHQMPVQMEAFKMAEQSGTSTRRLSAAMMAAVFAGLVSGYWALLSDAYGSKGARGTGFAAETFRHLHAWIIHPQGPRPLSILFIGLGAAFALLLGAARMRFLGWPFHPAGYALGMVFGLDYVWMPILIGWVCKAILLRYGGLPAYRGAASGAASASSWKSRCTTSGSSEPHLLCSTVPALPAARITSSLSARPSRPRAEC